MYDMCWVVVLCARPSLAGSIDDVWPAVAVGVIGIDGDANFPPHACVCVSVCSDH